MRGIKRKTRGWGRKDKKMQVLEERKRHDESGRQEQ